MEEMIVLKNITKTYKSGKDKIKALDALNLVVNKGDFLAITGSSGSGKSTLMNILGFLDTPDSGEYYFNGESYNHLSNKALCKIRGQKIGFVFQSFHLLQGLTAYQNVELPLIYNKVPFKKRHTLCKNALSKVGLSNRINHLPSQLSGGQKQRVAIARAIALSPPLILADEPTGNLDPTSCNDILNLLLQLNKEGSTVIMITHDKELSKRAKSSIEIFSGKINKPKCY